MAELTQQQQDTLVKARGYYPGHDGAVGVFQAEGISGGLLKSGVDGGPWGGTQRGGVPRGTGWGFTGGGPSQGNVSTHVEGHAAAIMWQRNLQTATVIVDRAMCDICSRDLSAALPPGATLYVISESEGLTIVRSSHAPTEPPPPLVPPVGGGTPGKGKAGKGKAGKGTAGTGTPWGGPTGTPGFDQSKLQGFGSAVALLQNWAESQSRMNIFWYATDEMAKREGEIIREQELNPLYPVYIKIYYRIYNENNPNLSKLYEYFGLDIKNGCNSQLGSHDSFWDGQQHMYPMVIPPLKAGSAPVIRQAPTTWRDGYGYVLSLLKGDRTHGGDPVAALRILNGSAMYDILPILKSLKTNEPFLFEKLEQALSWPTANVGVERLEAAFLAVRLSENPGKLTDFYKKPFTSLPADQQKNIDDFLSGRTQEAEKALNALPETLNGTWNFVIGDGGWSGIITFTKDGRVSWYSFPGDKPGGTGKWKADKNKLSWQFGGGDIRTFVLKLPLNPSKSAGEIQPQGQGWFSISKQGK